MQSVKYEEKNKKKISKMRNQNRKLETEEVIKMCIRIQTFEFKYTFEYLAMNTK